MNHATLDRPRISVVIPSFNRLHTLPRALDSVRAQTVPPDEIIVVDDGSSDGTARHLARYYKDVKCMVQKHAGVSAARNGGIRAARGDWIALLDSDDTWHSRKLERQAAALTDTSGYRVCHTDEVWIRDGRRVNPGRRHAKQGGWIFRQCLPLCAMSPSSILIHRDVFDETGLFDESLPACEDYDLWLQITARYPVLFVPEALTVKYGGHDDQLSRQYPAMDLFRIQALERILRYEHLRPSDRANALAMVLQKIEIVMNGARKRGRRDIASAMQNKYHYHSGEHVRIADIEGAAA